MDRNKIGHLGESFIIYHLSKLGLYSQKQNTRFDYDILVENDCKIEVKTSSPRKYYRYEKEYYKEYFYFGNVGKKQNGNLRDNCDFYCLVCIDKNYEVENTYIIPKKIMNTRRGFNIPRENIRKKTKRFSLEQYKNNFKPIKDFKITSSSPTII